MQDEHNSKYSHEFYPPPQLDVGIGRRIRSEEYCGFLNKDQLHNWFSEDELKLLEKDGFPVVEIDGEVTIVGKHQVLFKFKK